jgi:outer membrane murein-binding lipoprotein Lpp
MALAEELDADAAGASDVAKVRTLSSAVQELASASM